MTLSAAAARSAVAIQYKLGPREVPEWRMIAEFCLWVANQFQEVTDLIDVEYVDYDPYESGDHLRECVQLDKTLLVSKLHSGGAHPYWINLMWRAVHDFQHHVIVPLDFGNDEICAGLLAYDQAPTDLKQYVFCEVAGQASYRLLFGHFPEQYFVRFDHEMIEAVRASWNAVNPYKQIISPGGIGVGWCPRSDKSESVS